jgi:hypothetical protein
MTPAPLILVAVSNSLTTHTRGVLGATVWGPGQESRVSGLGALQVSSSSPAKRSLFAAAGTVINGFFSSMSPSRVLGGLGLGAPAADGGMATMTNTSEAPTKTTDSTACLAPLSPLVRA